jgi:hypothetical protein
VGWRLSAPIRGKKDRNLGGGASQNFGAPIREDCLATDADRAVRCFVRLKRGGEQVRASTPEIMAELWLMDGKIPGP